MLLLVTLATTTLRSYKSPNLGRLMHPRMSTSVAGTIAAGIPWAADNDCYSGFDPKAYVQMLGKLSGHENCLFVTAPDVVGEARPTLELFDRWEPILRELNLPVALVGQDGLEPSAIPWSRMDAFFMGGTNAWKMSPAAAELAADAKRRGKWVHMGRVNTYRRFNYARVIGCDSVDGSGFARWHGLKIPLALQWMTTEQPSLLHQAEEVCS